MADLGRHALALAAAALVASCAGGESHDARALAPSLSSGTVHAWPEATRHLLVRLEDPAPVVELGPGRLTGLDALWSIASTGEPRSGFFYADIFHALPETRVAYASRAASVADLVDVSSLAWSTDSVGPVPVGGIVVVEHATSGRYLALVLDAIEPTDPRSAGAGPYAHADVTWYLTPPGATGFSDTP